MLFLEKTKSPMGAFDDPVTTEKDETGGQSPTKLVDFGVEHDVPKNQNLQYNWLYWLN